MTRNPGEFFRFSPNRDRLAFAGGLSAADLSHEFGNEWMSLAGKRRALRLKQCPDKKRVRRQFQRAHTTIGVARRELDSIGFEEWFVTGVEAKAAVVCLRNFRASVNAREP